MASSLINKFSTAARISLALSLALTCLAQAPKQSPKSNEPLVFTATVTSAQGAFVGGLKQDDFQVFVDKRPARIVYARSDDAPLSIGILFDASDSVGVAGSKKSTRPMVEELQRALRGFIERSNQANEYFVLAFNETPQLLLDWSSDAKVIVDALGGLQPRGNTAFYDTCYLAIDKVQHGRYPKRVLLVISDGQDTYSRYYLKHVHEALKESDVLFYAINVFKLPDNVFSTHELDGQGALDKLSEVSGGSSYSRVDGRRLDSQDAASILETIATELRNQYSIAIEPGAIDGETGKWHKLKLKVTPPDKSKFSIRSREGFYSSHR